MDNIHKSRTKYLFFILYRRIPVKSFGESMLVLMCETPRVTLLAVKWFVTGSLPLKDTPGKGTGGLRTMNRKK